MLSLNGRGGVWHRSLVAVLSLTLLASLAARDDIASAAQPKVGASSTPTPVAPKPTATASAQAGNGRVDLYGRAAEKASQNGLPNTSDSGASVPKPHPVYGWYGRDWVLVTEHVGLVVPECVHGAFYTCPGVEDLAAHADVVPSRADVEAVAREAVLRMVLDRPVIHLGPEPSANEWDMAVVGYPLWLWTSEPANKSASVTVDGIALALRAHRSGVAFNMGDGSRMFSCTSMTPWPGESAVGVASPDCGYVFGRASAPGTFTVSATGSWEVEWSALGYAGTIPVDVSASRVVRVGELQSVLVKPNP